MLERIAAADPVLNAFSQLSGTVLDAAQAATRRWQQGAPMGPLDGVPMVIKDNLVVAGLPAAWGNAALARRVAGQDESPVAALRAAGALVLGKGNTPEFAVEGYTGNATFGTTRNPFDPDLTPGGSSGGVVAAVASGMAVAGLATDGGGSIRRPAGYCGLYGLKPGIGHVRRAGGLPQLLLDFEVAGPVTRSLRDLRLLDAVLSGKPAVAAPARARILTVETLDDAPCDPGIRAALARTAEALRQAGHRVEAGALPCDLADLNAGWGTIAEVGLAALFADDPEIAEAAAPKYRDMAARGAGVRATELAGILAAVFRLRNESIGLWGFDAILMPASAAHPWPAGDTHPPVIDGQPVGPRGHAVYTGWVNAAGLPALAFPAETERGLPIGMQLIGPMGTESRLMDIIAPVAPEFRWPDPDVSPG
nr:amidase [Mesobacterium pallidum]